MTVSFISCLISYLRCAYACVLLGVRQSGAVWRGFGRVIVFSETKDYWKLCNQLGLHYFSLNKMK